MGATLSIGRLAGTPVRVHWSLLIIAGVLAASLSSALGIAAALVGVLGFVGSIVAHEVGHALTARRYGIGTISIDLWALGGLARLEREAPTPRSEAAIAAAGPASSMAVGMLSAAVWFLLRGRIGWEWASLAGWLAAVNIALGVFNMLPGSPLDGGRVVRAWRWSRHGDRIRAMREAARIGIVVGWLVAGVGVLASLRGFSSPMIIVVGVFIAMSARVEVAAADLRAEVSDVRLSELMWWGIAEARPDTTVAQMRAQRSRLGAAEIVAISDGPGSHVGFVVERDLDRVPVAEADDVLLADIMTGWDSVVVARPEDLVVSVLDRIDPHRPLIVVPCGAAVSAVVPPSRLRARLGI